MNRPCLDCGTPSRGSRCADCSKAQARSQSRRRGSTAQRGYGNRWRVLSERARKLQPFCARCGTTEDLTTDHTVALANGGTRRPTLADVTVLCRSCNASKGARPDQTGMAPRTQKPARSALQAKSELLISVEAS